jgi:superfamily II DNA or RNA helicase
MLYDYQIEANKKIKELFKTVNKICFAASCGAGKNYMAISYIDEYLQENPEAKVLVLTHGQVILRKQFESACDQFESDCQKLSPNFKKATVITSSDMKKHYDNNNSTEPYETGEGHTSF